LIEAREFGEGLRRERERHGIALDAIAEQTKVSASLLAGLERGDLSRWPAGIFRRAFVRSYALTVGLNVEETLTEFLRVFPEDGGPSKPKPPGTQGASSMRLALGDSSRRPPDWRWVGGAAIDMAVVASAAATAWSAGALEIAWMTGLGAALAWHLVGTLLWGTSPGVRLLQRRPVQLRIEPVRLPVDSQAQGPDAVRPSTPISFPTGPRGRNARRERRLVMRAERHHRR
jgi:transcriptional regulator with XRE-family HTH domain